MKKESVYTTNFVSDDNVGHFLKHLGDCSEGQVTDFLKLAYAASQERITKGKDLVADDSYLNEENLNKALEKCFR